MNVGSQAWCCTPLVLALGSRSGGSQSSRLARLCYTEKPCLWRDFENAEVICLLSEKCLQHNIVSPIYSYEASIVETWQRKLMTVCWELRKPSDRRVCKADPEGHVVGQKEILGKRRKEPI